MSEMTIGLDADFATLETGLAFFGSCDGFAFDTSGGPGGPGGPGGSLVEGEGGFGTGIFILSPKIILKRLTGVISSDRRRVNEER